MLDLVVSAASGCFLWTFKVGWGCTKPILTLCKKFHKFPWYVTRLLQLEVEGLGIWGGMKCTIFPQVLFHFFPWEVIDAVRFLSGWMWEKLVQDFPWISMSSLNLLHHIFAKTSVYWINWIWVSDSASEGEIPLCFRPINISLKARGQLCTLHHISLNRAINISLNWTIFHRDFL